MADLALAHREEAKQRRTLVTPEGVDLSLSLADAWQRMAAFLFDLLAMGFMLLILLLLCNFIAEWFGWTGREIALVVLLLGFFVLRSFYFVLLEIGPRAATFGKRLSGLRVVARSGERLTADRVIARNMMREVEFYLPLTFLFYNLGGDGTDAPTALVGLVWTGLFLLFPLFNRDRMRVGDLLAGTWVVRAPRRTLRGEVGGTAWEGVADHRFTEAQLDVYGVFELQTLERVLRDSQADAVANVAAAIRRKIGYAGDGGPDYPFLSAYYNAARTRMERGLLFGKRRADKHDKA
ncbi:MAG: hypothetical protein QOD42_3591 [Sphingomonadales bacterium]|jgi:uncharacterized RDD family membrane protein YckC|nr:hypothetical protein [Sphingomonadales bacterium]